MNDSDEDFVVDFSGHFSERGAVRENIRIKHLSKTVCLIDRSGGQNHTVKGKRRSDLTPKRSKELYKEKALVLHTDTHDGLAIKRKAISDGVAAGLSSKAKRVNDDLWPFQVDYNDHFESPLEAVQDIEPVLHLLSKKLKKSKTNLVVYDPFFCQGGIRRHYEQLGYKNFIHRNRDFYQDVDSGNVPLYDILVTNPPYSSDHKERILEFCLRSGKPWALLLPNYVATKAYFGELLKSTSTSALQLPFFLTPSARYSYEHPEGTGHTESPFFSIWYIGLGDHTEAIYGACKARLGSPGGGGGSAAPVAAAASAAAAGAAGKGDRMSVWEVSISRSVDALRQAKVVPTARRLNPKQRARLKQQRLGGGK